MFRTWQEVALLELEIGNWKEGLIFLMHVSLPLVVFELCRLKLPSVYILRLFLSIGLRFFSFTDLISSILKRIRNFF